MATTDLKLDEPGTLPKPGPVGRLARLALGLWCIWFVSELIGIRSDVLDSQGHVRVLIWNGVLPGLFLISYVVNIGFSRAWKKRPAILVAAALLAVAAIGYLLDGTMESSLFARTIWVWELYLFGHLGLSFLIAAIIRTPGCEMRALHDLYSRTSGVPTKEHYCPVGPLTPIDQWEARR